jgi:hypothetical protein
MTEVKTRRLWRGAGVLIVMAAFLLIPWLRAEAAEPGVAAGGYHTVGLKSDGTVVAVGDDSYGQTNVGSWTNIAAVAAGYVHTVGLKSDGTVVAVGDDTLGQTNVGSWTNIVAVAAGDYHTVGLKSDGTVVAVGDDTYGQTNVDSWTNIVAVAAGELHTVGLKSDGTVVAVGWNDSGQTNVGSWTNIVAVSAGFAHTVGLKSDGTVVAVGYNGYGQTNVGSWTNSVAVAAGDAHTVGLKSDGTVVAVGDDNYGQTNVSSWGLELVNGIKGTKGTEVIIDGAGFGSKKGTLLVGTAPAQIVAWFDSMIIFKMTGVLSPGEYPIYVTPKGAKSPTTYGRPFIVRPAAEQFVWPNAAAPGHQVVLAGKYFGSKKGKVSIGAKACPVTYWYMAPESGKSIAAFTVPKGLAPGSYNVTLTIGGESTTLPTAAFTVKPKSGSLLTDQEEAFPEGLPDEGE